MRQSTNHIIIRIALLIFSILTVQNLYASVRTMKITEAIAKKIIAFDGVNTLGNYTGPALKLIAKTTKKEKDSIILLIDVGIIMKPDDTSYQPMVVAGGDTMIVAPNKTAELVVNIFCGNSPRHCPRKNLHYSFLKLGSTQLIDVLSFINENKLYNYLGQHAVWVITNDSYIGNVYESGNETISKKLIKLLCSVTGKPEPKYFSITANNETPGSPAYSTKTLSIVTEFETKLKGSAILSVGVFDDKNNYIEQLIDRKLYLTGKNTIKVTFNPLPYGPGKYTIKLIGAQGVLQEKVVTANE